MNKIISLLIVMVFLPVFCYGGIATGNAVDGSAPTGEINVFLAGDETIYGKTNTLNGQYATGNQVVCSKTGTVKNGYLNVLAADNNDSMILIYDSSDNLLAISETLSDVSEGLNEYTFSGVNQITLIKDNTYRLCIWTDGNIFLKTSYDTANVNYDISATWSTPPDPFSTDGNYTFSSFTLYVKGDT